MNNKHFRTWRKRDGSDFYDSGSRQKWNLLMAVTSKKILYHEITEINTDADVFGKFINRTLDQLNEEEIKNFVVVMDNASFHREKEIMKYYKDQKFRILFNCPYRSEFNMIELAFRHLNNFLYKNLFETVIEFLDRIEEFIFTSYNPEILNSLLNATLREYI